MTTIDNVSPPGAWEQELKAAPWGFGQAQSTQVQQALVTIRLKGLNVEAAVLEREIVALKREVEALRGNGR